MGIPLRDTAIGPGWSSVWRQTWPAGPVTAECVWSGRAGRDGWLRVFPDGCADLTWNGDRLRLVPASATVRWVRLCQGTPADGVRLRCGAARALLGPLGVAGSVVELRDVPRLRSVRPLERDLRAAADDSGRRRQLLAQWVADQPVAREWLASSVIEQLAAGLPVPAIASAQAVSERTLRREVADATGLSPKPLGRVLRFRRFLEVLRPLASAGESLAVTAARLGYADQSHLGRECRAIAASTPASLVRSWRRAAGQDGRNLPDSGRGGARTWGRDRRNERDPGRRGGRPSR